jgi:hypothetical protein
LSFEVLFRALAPLDSIIQRQDAATDTIFQKKVRS